MPERPSTAAVEGPEWSARAGDWAALCAPAMETLVQRTAVGAGTRLLDGAGFGRVTGHAGMGTVPRTLAEAGAPFRRPDGSYRFENRLRFVIARRSPARSGRPARAGAR